MNRLSLNLAELVVESFPTVPERRLEPNLLDHSDTCGNCSTDGPLCDTYFDCSTNCIVATNVCHACEQATEEPSITCDPGDC